MLILNLARKTIGTAIAALLLCVACSPATTSITPVSATETPTPTTTPESSSSIPWLGNDQQLGTRYTYRQGGFSLKPPKDWKAREISGLKYSVLEANDGSQASINIVEASFSGSLAEFADSNLTSVAKAFKNFKKISQSDFQTSSGVTGIVVVSESQQLGKQLRQSFYFFASPTGKKFAIACTSPAKDGDKFAPIFEASLKTFKFGI